MERLSKSEISELKGRLAKWQPPGAMEELYDDTVHRIGSVNLFNQGGLAFLRDAYVAAEFGKARNIDKVRLVSDTWPDFELLIGDHIEPFEAVEADEPGRQRGVEYRDDDGEVQEDTVEDWVARAEQAPAWLDAACRKKAAKRYGSRANLVIYLNMNEFGVRHSEVISCFPHATRAVKADFEAVWVLWKGQAYRVWRQSNALEFALSLLARALLGPPRGRGSGTAGRLQIPHGPATILRPDVEAKAIR